MSTSLTDTINLWRKSRTQGGDEPLWSYLVRTNPWVFSHHPEGECFHEHVWTFRGLHFCKGCVMTLCGACAAVVVQACTGWLRTVSIGWIGFVFVSLLLPAVLTSFFKAPRPLKHVARVLLGAVMASTVWLFCITDQWWVRGVLVVVYFSVKLPLDRRRRRQNMDILHVHEAVSHSHTPRAKTRSSAKQRRHR